MPTITTIVARFEEISSMIDMPNADKLLSGPLGDWLQNQQQGRAQATAKINRIWTIACIACVALSFLIIFYTGHIQPVLFILVFGSIPVFWWTSKIRSDVVNGLKQEINGELAKALDVAYSLNVSEGEEFRLARGYELLPSYDDSYFQDEWQGTLNDTEFLMYEIKLTEEQGSGKSRRTVTVFEGIILRFRFGRPFLSATVVRRNSFKITLFGDSMEADGRKLERAKMVDPKFEEIFDVYTSDPVEGRYLVHPEYCERLLALENNFGASDIAALFLNGDMIVTCKAKDMFESASLDPSEDRKLIARTINQFASMQQLVKTLNERPRG
jgi:hypothetical protein